MVVETKFMTVDMEDVSAICKNDKSTIFVVFKSGSTQTFVYAEGDKDCAADYRRLSEAKKGNLEFPAKK